MQAALGLDDIVCTSRVYLLRRDFRHAWFHANREWCSQILYLGIDIGKGCGITDAAGLEPRHEMALLSHGLKAVLPGLKSGAIP